MSDFLLLTKDQAFQDLRGYYSQRKVLVVGGNGFLGINCVRALQELNAQVSVFTRSAYRISPFNGEIILGDLLNEEVVHEAVRDKHLVFNFAGGGSASESNQFPEKSLKQEVQSNLVLVNACATVNPSPLLINCSSRLIYGKPQYLPVDEMHPINPQSIYAAHKMTVEHYLGIFRLTHGLRSITFRLSNPYGPYQPPQYKGYGVINKFLQDAAAGKTIHLFGDGLQRRDYIFVEDAIVLMLKSAMLPSCENQTFNLGGQNTISLADAAHLIAELADRVTVQHVEWPTQNKLIETGDYATNLEKLYKFVPFSSQCSLRDGFRFTLDFYKQRLAE